jgi:ABC-type lipoprotein release transport system permease subunit
VALLAALGIVTVAVCALACIGPTRRALRVEPTEALSTEV